MKGYVIHLLSMLLVLSGSVQADELAEVLNLSRAGASQLALQRLEQVQPGYADSPVDWMRWEQARIEMLEQQGDWAAISDRVRVLPRAVPGSFRSWLWEREADAWLAAGRADAARAVYRRLLWQADREGLRPEQPVAWRLGVIRSYLDEGLLTDAETAIRRFQFDFPGQAAISEPLMAEVLLQLGKNAEALELLAAHQRADTRSMYQLARLAGQPQQAAAIATELRARLKTTEDEIEQYRIWVLLARAAAVQGQQVDRIRALEQALLRRPQRHDGLFHVDPDALWQAWLDYGYQYGNEHQLLIGRDEDWYFAATEKLEKDPILARALFAVLGFRAAEPTRRLLAHDYLSGMTDELAKNGRLTEVLYRDSSHFPAITDIPVTARYRLIDDALAQGKLQDASALMQGLSTPPAGKPRWTWELRRARVLILGGETQQGIDILQGLLSPEGEAGKPLKAEDLDALMQVVFDLQKLKLHREALQLFGEIGKQPLDLRRRRELLFWMAESWSALGEHAAAARAYLVSAMLENPLAMDPWAQTARYHAARALIEAGYQNDARTILTQLLHATRDADRRAVLRHELFQLNGRREAGIDDQ